jgi:hypothetical protein
MNEKTGVVHRLAHSLTRRFLEEFGDINHDLPEGFNVLV